MDHGSTDAQDWRVKQLWYKDEFNNSPEELDQKYAHGEVDTVILEEPLPKNTVGPTLFLHGLQGLP